jgi:hypothetical protein
MEHNVLATPTVAKSLLANHPLQMNRNGKRPSILKLDETPNIKKNNKQEKS